MTGTTPFENTGSADASRASSRSAVQATQMTGWVGWIAYAGTMMVLLGVFHMFQGLVALLQDSYFLVANSGLVVTANYTTWGWTHLIGGALLIGGGAALFAGQFWARGLAVILAMASAVLNIGFLAAYPIWSTIMIAMDMLVIWAVVVHGKEVKAED